MTSPSDGVQRVVASTSIDNFATRVLEKAGLTLVRTFYHTSTDSDAVEYAVEKDDWHGHAKAKL